MDGEKLIQVSFQIPPSALDSLSRLAEQLRMLTETVSTQTAPVSRAASGERGESDSFDPERFLMLQQGADAPPQAVRADVSDIGDAAAVSAGISQIGNAETAAATISQTSDAEMASAAISQTSDAETASAAISQISDAETASAAISQAANAETVSAEVLNGLQDAESAGSTLDHPPVDAAAADAAAIPQNTLPEERDIPLPPAEPVQTEQPGMIPAVRAAAEQTVPDAPEARRDAVRQVPDVENARADAEDRALLLAAAQGEVSGSIEAPLGAGTVIQTQPEMPQSRWSGVTEELVIPGPAPLTAEAVSLAFERDGRRYDNGFPLY